MNDGISTERISMLSPASKDASKSNQNSLLTQTTLGMNALAHCSQAWPLLIMKAPRAAWNRLGHTFWRARKNLRKPISCRGRLMLSVVSGILNYEAYHGSWFASPDSHLMAFFILFIICHQYLHKSQDD